MSKLTIRMAEMADIYALAETARAADRLEVERGWHDSVLDALIDGRERGPTFAARYDGKLLCVFGLAYMSDRIAAPWLLGTEDLFKHPVVLMRAARCFIVNWAMHYDLINQVDSENERSIRFLKSLGFKFYQEPSLSPSGHPFLVFYMEKRDVRAN